MAYVRLGNMEMEWFSDKEYRECIAILNEFKLLAAKEWEVTQGEENSDEKKRHTGSEGNPAK